MPGLRADYPWHARCLPAAYAAHRRRAGVAHPCPTKQDCCSGCAHAPSGKQVGGGQAECMPRVVGAHAGHRPRPPVAWATPRLDDFEEGKILGEILTEFLAANYVINVVWSRSFLIHDFAFTASTWPTLPSFPCICREGERSCREEERRKNFTDKKKSS